MRAALAGEAARGHVPLMAQDTSWRARWPRPEQTGAPVVDMTADGRFAAPPARTVPLTAQVFAIAVLVAVLAGVAAIALLALWLALLLVPVAIGGAAIAYGVFRFRAWQARALLGRKRDVMRS